MNKALVSIRTLVLVCTLAVGLVAVHGACVPMGSMGGGQPAQSGEPAAPPSQAYLLAFYSGLRWAGDEVSCAFDNCATNGWTMETDMGQVEVACSFNDCLSQGWTTTFPDGSTTQTQCNFGNCLADGWTTTLPDGSSAATSCNFNQCATDGWTTNVPDGSVIACSCGFNDCAANGIECN